MILYSEEFNPNLSFYIENMFLQVISGASTSRACEASQYFPPLGLQRLRVPCSIKHFPL